MPKHHHFLPLLLGLLQLLLNPRHLLRSYRTVPGFRLRLLARGQVHQHRLRLLAIVTVLRVAIEADVVAVINNKTPALQPKGVIAFG